MKAFFLIVGLACVNGASIDELMPDITTDSSVYNGDGGDAEAFTWKYDTQTLASADDPASWYGTCNTGTSQSPINIVRADVETATTDIGAITGTLFDRELEGYLVNNGRVLRFSHLGFARPAITGGALGTKVYAFSHIDFHFGTTDSDGSEHTIDGRQYAMEMEAVFYDGSFMSSQDALASTDADALVTISNLFQISTTDNANMKPIVDEIANILYALPSVMKKRSADNIEDSDDKQARQMVALPLVVDESPYTYGSEHNNIVPHTLKLIDILGADTVDSYYYYDGSMTQPTCMENTKWIINQKMLDISSTQLAEFRTLMTDTTYPDELAGNVRPTQPLGTRTVMQRVAPLSFDDTQLQLVGGTLAAIPTFFFVNQFLSQPDTAKALRENPVAEFVQTNFDNLFNPGQTVVQQRSSDEAEFHHQHQYQQQPVYQASQYQQYVPAPQPAPAQ